MNIYAIYVNTKQKDNNLVVIKEGFSWGAAVFNVFWTLYHKMWGLLSITLVFYIIVALLNNMELIQVSRLAAMLIFGFLASDLREYDLKRKDYQLADIILAYSPIEAELKFLERNTE